MAVLKGVTVNDYVCTSVSGAKSTRTTRLNAKCDVCRFHKEQEGWKEGRQKLENGIDGDVTFEKELSYNYSYFQVRN